MLISAVELAGLQLPKLPNSRQGIEYHAKKNNWPFEEVAGRARGGKLKKYLVSALPSEVQAAIREKQAATLLAKVPVLPAEVKKPLRQNKKMRQLGLIPCEEGLARLDDRQTETAHARCVIVAHVLPLHELAGMPIKKAVAFVVAEAAAGRLPEDVARLIPLANARNSEVTVLAQSHSGKNNIKATAKDESVKLHRPLIVTEPDIDSQAQAQRKAKKRLADSRLEGLTITATVQRHRTDDGTLWQPGQRINVLSEPDGIDAVYFLIARTFTGGRGQPTETVLTLQEDGAWVLDADPPKKSGKTQRPSESRKANGQAAAKPKKCRQAKQAGQEVQVI